MHTHVHSCTPMYTHVHLCTQMYTYEKPVYTLVHLFTPMYTHVHHVHPCTPMYTTYTHVHPCTPTYNHVYMLMYIHVNVYSQIDMLSCHTYYIASHQAMKCTPCSYTSVQHHELGTMVLYHATYEFLCELIAHFSVTYYNFCIL